MTDEVAEEVSRDVSPEVAAEVSPEVSPESVADVGEDVAGVVSVEAKVVSSVEAVDGATTSLDDSVTSSVGDSVAASVGVRVDSSDELEVIIGSMVVDSSTGSSSLKSGTSDTPDMTPSVKSAAEVSAGDDVDTPATARVKVPSTVSEVGVVFTAVRDDKSGVSLDDTNVLSKEVSSAPVGDDVALDRSGTSDVDGVNVSVEELGVVAIGNIVVISLGSLLDERSLSVGDEVSKGEEVSSKSLSVGVAVEKSDVEVVSSTAESEVSVEEVGTSSDDVTASVVSEGLDESSNVGSSEDSVGEEVVALNEESRPPEEEAVSREEVTSAATEEVAASDTDDDAVESKGSEVFEVESVPSLLLTFSSSLMLEGVEPRTPDEELERSLVVGSAVERSLVVGSAVESSIVVGSTVELKLVAVPVGLDVASVGELVELVVAAASDDSGVVEVADGLEVSS